MNQKLLRQLQAENIEVDIARAEAVEAAATAESKLDKMWSFVGKKTNPRWLWHGIDRNLGRGLASVFGRRKAQGFLPLQEFLEPLGIKRYYLSRWLRSLGTKSVCTDPLTRPAKSKKNGVQASGVENKNQATSP